MTNALGWVLLAIGLLWLAGALFFGAFWTLFAFLWWAFPMTLLALAILFVGYLAYEARTAKDEARARPPPTGPDPVDEFARLNRDLSERLRESRATLEATRETLRKGLKGDAK